MSSTGRSALGRIGGPAAAARWVPELAIVLAAYVLRTHDLGLQSIWFDEAWSMHVASLPIPDLLGTSLGDLHPPGYYVLLHYWIGIAGTSEYAARYSVLLFGTVAVAAAGAIGRRLGGRALGLAAAAALAVSPFAVFYSRETRMYGPLAATAVLAGYAFLRLAARPGAARAAAYAIPAAALCYVHYLGPPLLVAHGAIVLARGRRDLLVAWLGAVAGVLAVYAPWLLLIAGRYAAYAAGAPRGTSARGILLDAATAFVVGYPRGRLPDDDHLMLTVLPAIGVGLALVGAVAVGRRWARLTLVAWLLIPTAVVVGLMAGRREFTARYLSVAAPALVLLIAVGVVALWRRSRPVGAVAAVVLAAAWGYALARQYADPQLGNDDFRTAATIVAERARPDQVVLVSADYASFALDYYLRARWPVEGLPNVRPGSAAEAASSLDEAVERHSFVWLLLWQDYFSDPEDALHRRLDERAFNVEKHDLRGGIRLLGYETRPPVSAGPTVARLVRQRFGDAIEMVGYDLGPGGPPPPGSDVVVRVDWRALRPVDRRYKVFVHLVDGRGDRIGAYDGEPVRDRYPTTRWPTDAVVHDEYPVGIPPGTPPGAYRLLVGLYDRETGQRLHSTPADFAEIPITIGG